MPKLTSTQEALLAALTKVREKGLKAKAEADAVARERNLDRDSIWSEWVFTSVIPDGEFVSNAHVHGTASIIPGCNIRTFTVLANAGLVEYRDGRWGVKA